MSGLGRNSRDPDAILRVSGVSKAFSQRSSLDRVLRRPGRETVALDDVSLTVSPGQALAVVGESGSGKTTLARTLVRLVSPDSGQIEFQGEDVLGASRRQLVAIRRRMQMVYQDPYSSLNGAMTVGAAIAEPALVHGLTTKREAPARVSELMTQVGLDPALRSRKPRALSGGQRQRVAIARSLAAEPDLLIADEAVSALDVSVQIQVVDLLARLREELGLTLIFISHQLAIVAQLCDEVAIMYRGQIIESGPTREVFRAPGHGYTAELIRAHPTGHSPRRTVTDDFVAPPPPPPLDEPGCPFRHRCAYAAEICATTPPPVRPTLRRMSRCHILPVEPEVSVRAGIGASSS